jgi:hypothetical protein
VRVQGLSCRSGSPPIPAETGRHYSESLAVDCVVPATAFNLFAQDSVSLEDEFWDSLKEIAGERGMTLGALVAAIDPNRQHANLSSAIRLFVLGVYRDQRR